MHHQNHSVGIDDAGGVPHRPGQSNDTRFLYAHFTTVQSIFDRRRPPRAKRAVTNLQPA